MENWWIWMSFWPSFNGMICRPWLFPIFSYIKHWLHWLRVKPAFVPSNEMFIRVYPFLYFLYGLRVQPLQKKTWPPSHETKWCGDKRGDISAILRVFPSGFPFGFPSGSLQCPVTRIPLDIEQDPWFFGRDSSWKQCHVAERCWKYPPLRNVSRQEWVANTKKNHLDHPEDPRDPKRQPKAMNFQLILPIIQWFTTTTEPLWFRTVTQVRWIGESGRIHPMDQGEVMGPVTGNHGKSPEFNIKPPWKHVKTGEMMDSTTTSERWICFNGLG